MIMQEGLEREHTALQKYAGVTSLTQEEAKEIINTMWPDADKASHAEVFKAMKICQDYGLNPLMRHIYLIPFDGKYVTVMGIGANRLIASRRHIYSYIDDTPRIMSEAEQVKFFGKVPNGKATIVLCPAQWLSWSDRQDHSPKLCRLAFRIRRPREDKTKCQSFNVYSAKPPLQKEWVNGVGSGR